MPAPTEDSPVSEEKGRELIWQGVRMLLGAVLCFVLIALLRTFRPHSYNVLTFYPYFATTLSLAIGIVILTVRGSMQLGDGLIVYYQAKKSR